MPGPRTPPAEDSALRLVYAVGRFHTVMRAELDRRLRSEGLSVPEFTALSVLRSRSGLSNAQLARRSLVTPQAMNQVLASLEDKGLVSRPRTPEAESNPTHPGHHRARAATLTRAGRQALRRADRVVDAIEDAAFAGLDEEERTALAGLLRDGAARLRGDVEPAPGSVSQAS